ncbi:hypothetical protein F4818DRAFT_135113 [Hypoxylon cercidicola]|nr:hypothetical protein F4818DRAFT_135113 [Hypoxylon cercidicola]
MPSLRPEIDYFRHEITTEWESGENIDTIHTLSLGNNVKASKRTIERQLAQWGLSSCPPLENPDDIFTLVRDMVLYYGLNDNTIFRARAKRGIEISAKTLERLRTKNGIKR